MIDQDDIIDFLRQNGGRVTNIELYVAFKVCHQMSPRHSCHQPDHLPNFRVKLKMQKIKNNFPFWLIM